MGYSRLGLRVGHNLSDTHTHMLNHYSVLYLEFVFRFNTYKRKRKGTMKKNRKNRSEKREERRKEEATKQTDQNEQYSKMFAYAPTDMLVQII